VSGAAVPPPAGPPEEDPRLTPARKLVYATGDLTVNTALASMNLVYVTYFLTQVAGLRPELAGVVQLVARTLDAVTDPIMGRISDRVRWRAGRRRPFFLIGALPFGVAYAALWRVPENASQAELLAYYTAWYTLLSVGMTIVSIPYLSLLPEMARGYDARTSLNTFRNVGSVLGVFAAAVTLRPLASALGPGAEGFARAGAVYGACLALPWLAVHAVSWERGDRTGQRPSRPLAEGVRALLRHASFRHLLGIFLGGRIAMDVVGAMLVVYFTCVIGRTEDFELTMGLFILAELISLPLWLRVATRFEKSALFAFGAAWWLVSFALILVAEPGWPRWLLVAIAPLGAVGYALVDVMPWSMLGEVIDEDDLAGGERREGLYNGVFTLIRKLCGTLAVWLALTLLGAVGFVRGATQSEEVRLAIRGLTAVAPAVFVALSLLAARSYPLTRSRHAEILVRLAERDRAAALSPP
jgi:sugar (glycoside-pentoside-hexuronide) transporter